MFPRMGNRINSPLTSSTKSEKDQFKDLEKETSEHEPIDWKTKIINLFLSIPHTIGIGFGIAVD